MTDTSTADTGPFPVFSANGTMQGNLTSIQGQPPAAQPAASAAAPGAAALAPQSPLSVLGPPPAPTAGPPPDMNINFPPQRAIPQTQKIGPAPDAQDYHKNALAFASAMAVLGAVSSKFTRMSGTASLSAFAGALKGWQEGNLQAYDQASKKWEQDTKATIENNKQILDDYKLTLENDQLNIDQQMAEIRVKAIKWHDQISYDAARQNNFTFFGKVFDKNWEYTYGEKGLEATAAPLRKENAQITEQMKLTAAKVISGQIDPNGIDSKTGQPYTEAQKLNLKYIVENYGPQAGKKVPSAQNLALQRYMEEHPNATGEEIQKFNAAGRPPRSAPAMALTKFLDEHPEATSSDIQAFQAKQAELSAEGRTKGVKETNLDIILRVTDSAIPAALAASDKVPRGNFVPVNRLVQKGKVITSDTNLAQFGMANLQLAEGWARAMNPTGVMREGDRDLALSYLSTATSKETYKALVEQLRTQIQRERAAIQSGKQSAVSAPGEMPSASESTGAGWTDLGNGVRIREKP